MDVAVSSVVKQPRQLDFYLEGARPRKQGEIRQPSMGSMEINGAMPCQELQAVEAVQRRCAEVPKEPRSILFCHGIPGACGLMIRTNSRYSSF